jgi:putative hemolysin
MRQVTLLIGAALLLAACQTATEEVDLEQEFADRCASRGFVSGTPEFKECVEDGRQIRLVRRSAGAVY